ncbi:hypothetical protein EYF80_026670 [Liparis tanakae]|uniref:Uncharacterized protein n=1 Tax=Liparis tanakae TaxID=230148 RepID=A0A4Z2HDS9_9TELE|nr:hypothetical protein EYF80_026670 [Liparis tanakae]
MGDALYGTNQQQRGSHTVILGFDMTYCTSGNIQVHETDVVDLHPTPARASWMLGAFGATGAFINVKGCAAFDIVLRVALYGHPERVVSFVDLHAVSPVPRDLRPLARRLNENIFFGADAVAEVHVVVAFGAVVCGPASRAVDGDLRSNMAAHLQHCRSRCTHTCCIKIHLVTPGDPSIY